MSDTPSDRSEDGYESEASSMSGVESGDNDSSASRSGDDEPVEISAPGLPPIVAYPARIAGGFASLSADVPDVPTYAGAGPVYAERFLASVAPLRHGVPFVQTRYYDSRRQWKKMDISSQRAR
ncbi:hypothetical protein DFP72DRAFT_856445 [Ephemerocybe angulata]|uniref:Uncharacterized protein n=1 Tax=Ephemerocybe angulata TaxID=980116 RepID=A0A8H6HEC4_9AGAR|nr:hypothetical protein DFP72DRAFT_856445 [Tulosesus angulatus]